MDKVLPKGASAIAAGISGGPDSMALAYLLNQWAAKEKVKVHALVVDHGLRAESKEEARLVCARLAKLKHITPHILTWKGRKPKTRILEEARSARYRLMAAHCRKHKIAHLFLAHHMDDQAETFLFRLAKGSGLDGLSGMKSFQEYSDGLYLVRPFLGVSKAELLAQCKKNKLDFVNDPTNESEKFARPRLRRSADILAEEGLTAKRLAGTARRLERARTALDMLADQVFEKAVLKRSTRQIDIDFNLLRAQPEEICFRVLIRAMESMRPGRAYLPRMESIEEILGDLLAQEKFRKRTLGGLIFIREDKTGLLRLLREGDGKSGKRRKKKL